MTIPILQRKKLRHRDLCNLPKGTGFNSKLSTSILLPPPLLPPPPRPVTSNTLGAVAKVSGPGSPRSLSLCSFCSFCLERSPTHSRKHS